jgi:hypothetical protein
MVLFVPGAEQQNIIPQAAIAGAPGHGPADITRQIRVFTGFDRYAGYSVGS